VRIAKSSDQALQPRSTVPSHHLGSRRSVSPLDNPVHPLWTRSAMVGNNPEIVCERLIARGGYGDVHHVYPSV
jgi:hypothetical protein